MAEFVSFLNWPFCTLKINAVFPFESMAFTDASLSTSASMTFSSPTSWEEMNFCFNSILHFIFRCVHLDNSDLYRLQWSMRCYSFHLLYLHQHPFEWVIPRVFQVLMRSQVSKPNLRFHSQLQKEKWYKVFGWWFAIFFVQNYHENPLLFRWAIQSDPRDLTRLNE